MKDLKLENLSPAESAELRRLANACQRATKRRYKREEQCRSAHARLATKRAELAASHEEEQEALDELNRFLAAHRQKPKQPSQTHRQASVANSWASRCQREAAQDMERARRERFTKLG